MLRIICLTGLFFLLPTFLNAQETYRLKSGEGKSLKMPYAKMALTAKLVGPVVSDPDYFIWCFSPLMTKDGKVHAFASRWPSKEKMPGWYGPNAEIAHYVADKPEGPFKFVKTIVNSKTLSDTVHMSAPHNPRLEYVDGKYVLLFIIQDPAHKIFGQKICMAVAENLNGPWHFAGNNGIVVKPSNDPSHWTYKSAIGTDNPAFLKIGKKYYIYFKSGTPEQMKAKYGYAVSDKLQGPYTLCKAPITDNVSYIEDAQAFSVKKHYYLLTTDNLGNNSGVFGSLILWKSDTGTDFKLKNAKMALGTIFDYWGKDDADRKNLLATPNIFIHNESGKLERPAILKIKNRPAYLYGPACVNIEGGGSSVPYVFKIDWNSGE